MTLTDELRDRYFDLAARAEESGDGLEAVKSRLEEIEAEIRRVGVGREDEVVLAAVEEAREACGSAQQGMQDVSERSRAYADSM